MPGYAATEEDFRRSAEEFLDLIEAELGDLAAHVERVVVPQMRREAGSAVRMLAGHLERLAGYLEPARDSGGKPGL